nr:MAG TPA: hypothetical protein [Caudoviricetes sp.]
MEILKIILQWLIPTACASRFCFYIKTTKR